METLDVINRYYELLAARDRDGLVALFADEFKVTYHAQPDAFPWSGVFEGVEGFDRFLAVIAEHLEIVEVAQTATIADDARVVVQCAGHWRVKANGPCAGARGRAPCAGVRGTNGPWSVRRRTGRRC